MLMNNLLYIWFCWVVFNAPILFICGIWKIAEFFIRRKNRLETESKKVYNESEGR